MRRTMLCVIGFIILTVPVLAHHGTGISYDEKNPIVVKGVVKEFLWRNPHSALFVSGKGESGKPAEYSIELGSPGQMVKLGYTKNLFKAGDHVILEAHPSFTNPASGECLTYKITVNGKVQGNPPSAGEPKGQ